MIVPGSLTYISTAAMRPIYILKKDFRANSQDLVSWRSNAYSAHEDCGQGSGMQIRPSHLEANSTLCLVPSRRLLDPAFGIGAVVESAMYGLH